jgi:hypothetical protein
VLRSLGVVVAKKLLAKAAQNCGVEDVDVDRGRRDEHLGIGECECGECGKWNDRGGEKRRNLGALAYTKTTWLAVFD